MRSVLAAAWLLLACAWVVPAGALAQETEVTLAGVAYSGSKETVDKRFAYSRKYQQQVEAGGDSPYKRVVAALAQTPPRNLKVTTAPIEELKGRDQALVVSLVLTSETVSVENFGDARKLFILLRGQALFFDFKSMTVVRAYPLSFAYIDNLRRDPTEADILERVKLVYEGVAGKPGLFGRFAAALATATVPQQTPRFLQVTDVSLPPDMLEQLPAYLRGEQSHKTWAADMVGEAISSRLGVPIVPYAKGYAIGGVMSLQVMQGDVYNLELPKPDYAITVDFKGLKKVKFGQTGAGASFVYGAFADMRIQETGDGPVFLNTALKNAEVKVVPASQTHVDDFPAFNDSLNGMFVKLADAMAGKGNAWVKTAAGAADIEAQISKTKDLMNLCK
ncbi:MAG TPA: hypothetical protein VHL79_14000 [Ramlibacter sp.]|jgi:hypothetical protein|nr:hypothetical protein [Ramlibacter sp.]